jgi:hypothetical protein
MFDILMETAFNNPSRLKSGGCAGRLALETGGIIVKALGFDPGFACQNTVIRCYDNNLLFLQTA